MDFPRPMLNSPANTGAEAAETFYQEALRRVAQARQLLLERACEPRKKYKPNYAEIVNQINLCIREIRPNMNAAQLAEMMEILKTVSGANVETILPKLRAIGADGGISSSVQFPGGHV